MAASGNDPRQSQRKRPFTQVVIVLVLLLVIDEMGIEYVHVPDEKSSERR